MAQGINDRKRDLGGFTVTRVLPKKTGHPMVGPFIFMDRMGPAEFPAGDGIDVRPHPHIGLSTITYLLEGSLLHRDSLGNNIEILPGDVNWMTAGRGIVHSERETLEVKSRPHRLDGFQCWLALPEKVSEIAPDFIHIKRAQLPHHMHDGVYARLIAGEAYGLTSPIKTWSPMFFLDVLIQEDKQIDRPNPGQECLVYVIQGEVEIVGSTFAEGAIFMLENEKVICANRNSRLLMLGGEAWPKAPHIYWNFVSFSKKRIDQAREEWQEGRFAMIPGDQEELTPLPGK